MVFEIATATDISFYTLQSRLKLDGVFLLVSSTLHIVCHIQSANGFTRQRQFQQIKKVM